MGPTVDFLLGAFVLGFGVFLGACVALAILYCSHLRSPRPAEDACGGQYRQARRVHVQHQRPPGALRG